MIQKTDICIIGGGVMGLASAYYLLKTGKRIMLLERTEVGRGASGTCDDMICLQTKKPGIALTWAMEGLELYRGLSSELEADIGFETRGGMVLIEDEKQLRVMEEYVRQQTSYGLDVEIVGRDVLLKKQPHVSERIIASTYCQWDSQVNPLSILRALLQRGLENGLCIMRGVEPTEIAQKGDHWRVAISDGEIECDSVLITAGAWSGQVAALCGVDIPIRPIRGQLAVTEQIAQIGETNNWSAGYIASKLDKSLMPDKGPFAKEIGLGFSFSQTQHGNYLIGSTREDIGFQNVTMERAISLIIKQAVSYFPVLQDVHIIRTISGFRPGTPDSNPIVGAIDGKPGLFIASGHEGDGVALAPITGKTIADMICGRNYDARYETLNPRRFEKTVGVAK